MILGGLALIGGLIHPVLGQGLAYLAWPFVAYTIRAVEWLAGIPLGVFDLGQLSLLVVVLIYTVLFGLTISGPRLFRSPASFLRSLLTPRVSLASLAIGAILIWSAALSAPDGRLHLTVLETDPPGTLLIQTPGGRFLLVNSSSPASQVNQAIGKRLPLFNRRLDSILVAAANKETFQTLPEVMASFPAGRLWWALSTPVEAASPAFSQYVKSKNLPVGMVQAGQYLDLGSGVRLEALAVGESGAVLRLAWNNFSAVLPVGADLATLETLQAQPGLGPATALLLAEEGAAELNPPEWIAKLRPQVALLCVAAGNRSDVPQETVGAVQGYTLLRTDRNGWIELSTDGKQLWVEVERK